jgi:hypothetical protein
MVSFAIEKKYKNIKISQPPKLGITSIPSQIST